MQQLFTPVQDHMLFQGLPNNIPFLPNINCRQHMQANVNGIMVMLISYIQTQPNASFLRQALFYRMAHNGYNNPDFLNLLTETVEYLDMLASTTPNCNLGQVAPAACEDMVNFYTAMEVSKDRRLEAYLAPQQQQDVAALTAQYYNLGQQITTFINNTSQQQQNTGLLNNSGTMTNVGRLLGHGQQPLHQQQTVNTGGGGLLSNSLSSQPRNAAVGGSLLNSTMAGGNGPAAQQQSAVPYRPVLQQNNSQAAAEQSRSPVVNVNNTKLVQQLPDVDPLDYIRTHPHAFDAMTQAAFFRQRIGENGYTSIIVDTNRVHEEVGVDYQLHKTQFLLNPRLPLPDVRIQLAAHDPEQQKRIQDMMNKLNGDHIVVHALPDLSFDLFRIMDYVPHSGQYHDDVRGYLADNDLDVDLENLGVLVRFVSFENLSYGEGMVAEFEKMSKASTVIELADMFLKLQDLTSLHHWTAIDRRMTNHLNEWLYRQSPDQGWINSFTLHVGKLVAALKADQEQEILERLDTLFLEELFQQTLNINNGQLYADMRQSPESNTPRLATYEAVLLVPSTAENFGWSCSGKLGLITKHGLPELHSLIERAQVFSDPKCRYVKLVTLDNASVYLFRSNDKHNYLIGDDIDFSSF